MRIFKGLVTLSLLLGSEAYGFWFQGEDEPEFHLSAETIGNILKRSNLKGHRCEVSGEFPVYRNIFDRNDVKIFIAIWNENGIRKDVFRFLPGVRKSEIIRGVVRVTNCSDRPVNPSVGCHTIKLSSKDDFQTFHQVEIETLIPSEDLTQWEVEKPRSALCYVP